MTTRLWHPTFAGLFRDVEDDLVDRNLRAGWCKTPPAPAGPDASPAKTPPPAAAKPRKRAPRKPRKSTEGTK